MTPTLEELRAAGELGALDEQLAHTLGRLANEERAEVLLAVALTARQLRRGHSCLDLERWVLTPPASSPEDSTEDRSWPPARRWRELLAASPLVDAAASAERSPSRPLILDRRGRLYLHRYWRHQEDLAESLHLLAGGPPPAVDRDLLCDGLERLFIKNSTVAIDWQRVASAIAVLRRLCVITGGPGTGKTTTVVKILTLLSEQALAAGEPPPRTLLLAPTGKAAARLGQSIRQAKQQLDVVPEVIAGIAENASTVHRALGSVGGSTSHFRHGPGRPLLADLVVLDEASMVDLALMSRLLGALPKTARCILLGDPDQLAAVEAGAVLADICTAPASFSTRLRQDIEEVAQQSLKPAEPDSVTENRDHDSAAIGDSIVTLQHSYRYSAGGLIEELATAVRLGKVERALQLLEQPGQEVLQRIEPPAGGKVPVQLITRALRNWRQLLELSDPLAKLELLEQFRILCAHRHGALGALAVDSAIERHLDSAQGLQRLAGGHYEGRPLILTRNDYRQELYNGDFGVIASHPQRGPQAYFAAADGVREVAPSWLPAHESALASSVHKSQGSEHQEVAIVLPVEISPVLSRQLLYTALTRARSKVQIFASREILRFAIESPALRSSGLADRLRDPPATAD